MNGSPEQLLLYALSNPGQFIQTNFDTMDNEMLTQILLTMFQGMTSIIPLDDTLWHSLTAAYLMFGYTLIHQEVPRSKLSEIIYYSRLTRTECLRSQFHPIHLMTLMPSEPPEAYRKLLTNKDYLPNIISVYDPNAHSPTVILLTIQKVNVHLNATPGEVSTTLPVTEMQAFAERMISGLMSELTDLDEDLSSFEEDSDLCDSDDSDDEDVDDDDDDDVSDN